METETPDKSKLVMCFHRRGRYAHPGPNYEKIVPDWCPIKNKEAKSNG